MFAGQILMGGVWGIFASLGIIAAQRLLPSAVATASAIFMSSTADLITTPSPLATESAGACLIPKIF
jgi:hypothetical protein